MPPKPSAPTGRPANRVAGLERRPCFPGLSIELATGRPAPAGD
jgi:hypothetical protein